jgi:hypothetical protein
VYVFVQSLHVSLPVCMDFIFTVQEISVERDA